MSAGDPPTTAFDSTCPLRSFGVIEPYPCPEPLRTSDFAGVLQHRIELQAETIRQASEIDMLKARLRDKDGEIEALKRQIKGTLKVQT